MEIYDICVKIGWYTDMGIGFNAATGPAQNIYATISPLTDDCRLWLY